MPDEAVIKTILSKVAVTRQEEYVAGIAGIYPGMLLKLNSSNQVILHTTSGGALGDEVIVAIEDYMQGKTVDDVYTISNKVQVAVVSKGDEVNLLIKDGEDIIIGDKIMSNGDGLLIEAAGATVVVGVATGVNDLSGSSNIVNALSPVRIV